MERSERKFAGRIYPESRSMRDEGSNKEKER